MNDTLSRLQSWYLAQCNDDWEHQYGIKIDTLDNPGWHIVVDLLETALSDKKFTEVKFERSEANWIHCRVREGRFEGFGGPENLTEIIDAFLFWAESCDGSR